MPPLSRTEKAEPYRTQILEHLASCKGNLVRVHEELLASGAEVSYQALTAFCRKHGIGTSPAQPTGRYHHAPGQEMQHDTSPHVATIAGKERRVQTASLVFCHSRMLFAQCYPRFSRFECKVFLTDALVYFGGACADCMIDNTHVIVQSGTGSSMVPVPEMAAFGERFGFRFIAHAVGDANRSGKVERPFHYIENNFFAGRTFRDFTDLNAQLRAWCERVNAKLRRELHGSARELFAAERVAIRPLPIHVPDVYALHHRIVDGEGYINLNLNRYSVPYQLIGRRLEIHETKNEVVLFDGPRIVATHKRVLEGEGTAVTVPEHRPPRSHAGVLRRSVSNEERKIGNALPRAADYVALLRRRGRVSVRDLRWLARMISEYPREPMTSALEEALVFGMADLERLERMVLRRVASDFFVLPRRPDRDHEEDP